MKNLLFLIFAIAFVALSCRKEDNFITDNNAQLEFSLDTLRFDTVFTTVGSATRILKVYNPHKEPIQISRIWLAEGDNSRFRINVDGIPTKDIEDIEIAGQDSLYIFGEVTVNPDEDISISPFVIEEDLLFETNGNTQQVLLEAWGQNANYIPNRYNQNGVAFLSCDMGEVVWDDPKPYVIYGVLVVDSCTLTLPENTALYIHGGIARTDDADENTVFYNDGLIFFLQNGKLNVRGTIENPVTIQGDRLEENFEDISGQWAGIRMSEGSTGHYIENAIIKNSIIGLRVDSSAELTIKNTQIYNTASSGLLAIHARVDADNCLFYNNGGNSVQLEYGGNYNFNYCTLASYGNESAALRLTNVLCLDPFCQEFRFYRLFANWKNSIIYGSQKDEIDLVDVSGDPAFLLFNYDLENCIVKVDEILEEEQFPDFFDHCSPCINADFNDPLFADTDESDYHLDTLSIAEQQALPINNINIDLEGNNRDGSMPDIGCYEYIYE